MLSGWYGTGVEEASLSPKCYDLRGAKFRSERTGQSRAEEGAAEGRDHVLLSHGEIVITDDPRFSVEHHPESNNYVVQIREVSAEDAGSYQCQVPVNSAEEDLRVEAAPPVVVTLLSSASSPAPTRPRKQPFTPARKGRRDQEKSLRSRYLTGRPAQTRLLSPHPRPQRCDVDLPFRGRE
ncbi:putative lachesin [Penaeus vannamei]|uniref:Putative lachesin n=1 Tax=Penaeus vannamei TaxID=6689 RepID=A0A3R7NV99_PENVA|nr:putative lachesin [Penaeus vannamei]